MKESQYIRPVYELLNYAVIDGGMEKAMNTSYSTGGFYDYDNDVEHYMEEQAKKIRPYFQFMEGKINKKDITPFI